MSHGKHSRQPEWHRAAFASAGALAVGACIFALTEQAPDATSALSESVEEVLVTLFGWVPGLYDAESGLWLGMGIRRWAHTAEFAALGAFVAAPVRNVKPDVRMSQLAAVSVSICAAFSLFDQCHKLFVPGRHFDVLDLGMYALGYCVAVAVVLAIWGRGD